MTADAAQQLVEPDGRAASENGSIIEGLVTCGEPAG